jgi:PST family polysaccharide transporter
MLGSNVVNYWSRNADNLVIGKFLGAASLGYYNRAYNLMLLPVTQLTAALNRVMFPALAAIQQDLPRVRRGYLRSLRIVNALTIPFLVGLASVAPAMVPFLWGSGWTSTVPLLQILCIAGVPQCMGVSVGWIYQSQGRTTTMFHMSVLGTLAMLLALAVGLHWGVQGVAWGVLVKSWLMLPLTLHVAGRVIGLKARSVLRQGTTTLLSAAVMAAAVWFTPEVLSAARDAAWLVPVQVLVGVSTYAISLRLTSPTLFAEVFRMARARLPGNDPRVDSQVRV